MSRELVRCLCGSVRGSDDDPPLQLPTLVVQVIAEFVVNSIGGQPAEVAFFAQNEPPRICRTCGAIYALPRQVEPSSLHH